MRAYRDRYDDFTAAGAQILAISTDKAATQAKFKRSVGAPFPFVADRERRLAATFGVKLVPLLKLAARVTFVIDTEGRVVAVHTGRDALDPTRALATCRAED